MSMRPPPDPRFRPLPTSMPEGARPAGVGFSFADRVMTAVAAEPQPTPARVFTRSLLRLSFVDAAASLASAWRLASASSSSAPLTRRLTSLALVLAVVATIGVGGPFAFSTGVGALRSIQAPAGPAVGGPTEPSAAPAVVAPEPSPTRRPKATTKAKATPRKKAPAKVSTPTASPQAKKSSGGSTTRAGAAKKARRDDRRERREPRETPEPRQTPEPADQEHD